MQLRELASENPVPNPAEDEGGYRRDCDRQKVEFHHALPRSGLSELGPAGTSELIGDLDGFRISICTLAGTYPYCYIRSMDAVLHALSDQSRRTVLSALKDGPATAGELAALLPIARPGVSRHLRVLREAGLVEVQQR